jgi:hypothetical protein
VGLPVAEPAATADCSVHLPNANSLNFKRIWFCSRENQTAGLRLLVGISKETASYTITFTITSATAGSSGL